MIASIYHLKLSFEKESKNASGKLLFYNKLDFKIAMDYFNFTLFVFIIGSFPSDGIPHVPKPNNA